LILQATHEVLVAQVLAKIDQSPKGDGYDNKNVKM
jgi:hypothetical protein